MLFVTGMQRSGTTLLEKLLTNHPQLSVLSQPFPFLFIEAKRSFLSTIGRGDAPYPLGDLFLEDDYRVEQFSDHLGRYGFTREHLCVLFQAMADYSGQCTRFDDTEIEAALDQLTPGDFMETVAALYRQLGHKPGAIHFGGKETICEEFLPYFLTRGGRCVVIIRDPRDMLASLNHGRGQLFGGQVKPTLFNLRQWRKSVAFVLHLQNHRGFSWVRYEDLVANPIESLNRLARMLDIDPFTEELFREGIKSQEGTVWAGNSSHVDRRSLDASSVGEYRRLVPASVVSYTEAVCYPELRHLGYNVSLDWPDPAGVIAAFEDPYEIVRENLRGFFTDRRRTTEELERVRLLSTAGTASRGYFLFDGIAELLREAVAKAR